MIRVTVLYPNKPDAKFDMAYYTSSHMPMVKQKCGAACKAIAAEKGLKLGRVRLTAGHTLAESIARPERDDGCSLRGGGGQQQADYPDQPEQHAPLHFISPWASTT